VSEFSDSFHLRSDDPADAVALLRAARVAGHVFPAQNGWVSFVCERGTRIGSDELAARVFAANTGLLVDYSYAEDHGCWVAVYVGSERVARLKVSFETSSRSFDRDAFIRLGLFAPPAADAIEQWMWGEGRAREYVVAEQLRLPRYQWLAWRYAVEAPSEDRIEVDAEGRVRTQEDTARDEIEELLRTLPPTRKRPGLPVAQPKPAKKAAPTKSTVRTPARSPRRS
jgi:hypothetical protein